jgi:hypothetical protein
MPYKRTGRPAGRPNTRDKNTVQEIVIDPTSGDLSHRFIVKRWWIAMAHLEVEWKLNGKWKNSPLRELARHFGESNDTGKSGPAITKARNDPRFIRLRDSLMKSALQVLERERNESPKRRAERIDRDAKTDASLRASLALAFDAAHRRR